MTDEKAIVAVAGSTGRTGSLIVKELLQRGYRVRALTRSAQRASALKDAGADVLEADISSSASLEAALDGAAYAVSALGSKKPMSGAENNIVDNLGIQNMVKAAKTKGLRQVVVISSIGTGDSKKAIPFLYRLLMGPVLKMKEKSEAFIRSHGVDYTILRPGGLSDKDLSGELAFGEGGKISGLVSRKDVARACVDALEKPAMKNRVLEVVDSSRVRENQRQNVIDLT